MTKRLDKGELNWLEFCDGKATIGDWKKNHATIEQFSAKISADTSKKWQDSNVSAFGKLDDTVFMVYTRKGKRNSLTWTTHTRKG